MIRYALRITRGFRGQIAVSSLAGIVRVITGLIFVAMSKRAVDIATGIREGDLAVCVAVLAGALMIELILTSVASRTTDLSEASMKNTLQQRLFDRILIADWNGREVFHSGDMLSRLTDDCRVVAECLCRTIPTAVTAIVQFLGAFIFLWYFSPALAITLLLLFPAFIFAGKVFYRKIRILSRRIRSTESRLQSIMQESIQHRILLLTCRHTLRMTEAIASLHRSRYRLIRRRTTLTSNSRTAVLAGFECGYLAAFLWGIAGLRNGTVSFGLMTAYLQLAGMIQRPMAELARLLPGLIQTHTAFSRLADIERLPAEAEPPAAELEENQPVAGIVFREVTFAYPGSARPVFSRFSHTFAPGSRTAVMGPTGAGKSTLLRLMLALLKPQEGEIELCEDRHGKLISFPVSASTRGRIIYVPQGNSLLSGTIRRNLLMGDPEATEEALRAALHTAAADFVYDLKNGLDTLCGEHGEGLSEGQAQRIAIARGLLRRGSILLLDEISSSLDEATERLLMERLCESSGKHTVVFVTHRAGIVPYCDSMLELVKGD